MCHVRSGHVSVPVSMLTPAQCLASILHQQNGFPRVWTWYSTGAVSGHRGGWHRGDYGQGPGILHNIHHHMTLGPDTEMCSQQTEMIMTPQCIPVSAAHTSVGHPSTPAPAQLLSPEPTQH